LLILLQSSNAGQGFKIESKKDTDADWAKNKSEAEVDLRVFVYGGTGEKKVQ